MTKAVFNRLGEKLCDGGYTSLVGFKRGIGQAKLTPKEYDAMLARGESYFKHMSNGTEDSETDIQPIVKPTPKQKTQLLAPESMSNGYNKPDDNVFNMDPETDINPDMIVLYVKTNTLARKHNLPFNQIIKRLIEINGLMKAVIANPNLAVDRDPSNPDAS